MKYFKFLYPTYYVLLVIVEGVTTRGIPWDSTRRMPRNPRGNFKGTARNPVLTWNFQETYKKIKTNSKDCRRFHKEFRGILFIETILLDTFLSSYYPLKLIAGLYLSLYKINMEYISI